MYVSTGLRGQPDFPRDSRKERRQAIVRVFPLSRAFLLLKKGGKEMNIGVTYSGSSWRDDGGSQTSKIHRMDRRSVR